MGKGFLLLFMSEQNTEVNKKLKILVVRFSSIGDIVLTTPVIRTCALQINAEIHYLTKPGFKSLLEGNPYISKIWTLDDDFNNLTDQLKAERFDYIIDLHKNIRSLKLCFNLGVKRYTYDKTTWEKFLIVNFKIDILPKLHVVDRYIEAVKKLGVINDDKGLDFFIDPSTDISGIKPFGPYIVAVIGATHFTKRLPIQKWVELINNNITTQFVLVGGPGEKEAANIIIAQCGKNVIKLAGLTSLQQSALLISEAEIIITNDTGMLHIAAALKKPIISLWGGTLKEYGFWPYYPDGIDLNTNFEVKDLGCRPCSKFGRNDCPKGHFKCMNDLDVNKIDL